MVGRWIRQIWAVALSGKWRQGTTFEREGDGLRNWLMPGVREVNRFERNVGILRTNHPTTNFCPYALREDLTAHSPFPRLETNRNDPGSGQQGEFAGNPSTAKRTGHTTEAPSPQWPKLNERDIREQWDWESAAQREVGQPEADFLVNITELDIARAGPYPTLGWPACAVMFPMGRPE